MDNGIYPSNVHYRENGKLENIDNTIKLTQNYTYNLANKIINTNYSNGLNLSYDYDANNNIII